MAEKSVEKSDQLQKINVDTLNGEIQFAPDVALSLNNLALKIEPRIDDFVVIAQENLSRYLKRGEGIQDFWNWLYSQDCTLVKIESGRMNFYAQDKLIDISEHTAPVRIAAVPEIIEKFMARRQEILNGTRMALAELKSEVELNKIKI